MRGAAWDDDSIAVLKRLWAAGETASVIGKRLGGLSRAAVLGKIHRLRLDADAPAKPKAPRKAKAAAKNPPPSRRRRKDVPASEKPAAGTGPRILFDLTNECCRWPYERRGKPFLFCADAGADVINGIPYCAQHMRIAYVVPPVLVKPKRPPAARAA